VPRRGRVAVVVARTLAARRRRSVVVLVVVERWTWACRAWRHDARVIILVDPLSRRARPGRRRGRATAVP